MSDTIYYRKGFGPSDGDSAVMSDAEVITMLESKITALRKRVEALEELTPDQVYQRVVMEMSNGGRRKLATDIAVMLHDLWPDSDFARHALQPNGEAE